MQNSPLWWKLFPWALAFVVICVGGFVWAQDVTNFSVLLNPYSLFPVLGIWAWSIMWTHYIVGEVRRLAPKLPKNMLYSRLSGLAAAALILLHPGILTIEQWRQRQGLPPESLYAYVGQTKRWAVVLGVIALILFLSFEVFDRVKEKPVVQKWWWLVNVSQTVAMSFIFFHALAIGSHLQSGWFRAYWIGLGIILLPCLLHTHWADWKKKQ